MMTDRKFLVILALTMVAGCIVGWAEGSVRGLSGGTLVGNIAAWAVAFGVLYLLIAFVFARFI